MICYWNEKMKEFIKGTLKDLILFAGSAFRTKINKALLKLQYDGSLQMMKDKWWGKKTHCEV